MSFDSSDVNRKDLDSLYEVHAIASMAKVGIREPGNERTALMTL